MDLLHQKVKNLQAIYCIIWLPGLVNVDNRLHRILVWDCKLKIIYLKNPKFSKQNSNFTIESINKKL